MSQNVLQQTDTSNTEPLISKQDINPLYHFFLCIDLTEVIYRLWKGYKKLTA